MEFVLRYFYLIHRPFGHCDLVYGIIHSGIDSRKSSAKRISEQSKTLLQRINKKPHWSRLKPYCYGERTKKMKNIKIKHVNNHFFHGIIVRNCCSVRLLHIAGGPSCFWSIGIDSYLPDTHTHTGLPTAMTDWKGYFVQHNTPALHLHLQRATMIAQIHRLFTLALDSNEALFREMSIKSISLLHHNSIEPRLPDLWTESSCAVLDDVDSLDADAE